AGLRSTICIAFTMTADVFYPFVVNPEVVAPAMAGSAALMVINGPVLKRTRLEGVGQVRLLRDGRCHPAERARMAALPATARGTSIRLRSGTTSTQGRADERRQQDQSRRQRLRRDRQTCCRRRGPAG